MIASLGMAAVAFACATPIVAAMGDPSYHHGGQYISELGAAGGAYAGLVNFGGFLPTGVFTILFSALVAMDASSNPRARWGLLLFSGVGWAYVVAALFPCDPGCPTSGSPTQSVHNAFGVIEYLGGGLGLLLLWSSSRPRPSTVALRQLPLVCAVVVLVAFAAMLVPELHLVRGLVQRVAEAALFLWVFATSLELWRSASMARSA
jgi:hypothetical protein